MGIFSQGTPGSDILAAGTHLSNFMSAQKNREVQKQVMEKEQFEINRLTQEQKVRDEFNKTMFPVDMFMMGNPSKIKTPSGSELDIQITPTTANYLMDIAKQNNWISDTAGVAAISGEDLSKMMSVMATQEEVAKKASQLTSIDLHNQYNAVAEKLSQKPEDPKLQAQFKNIEDRLKNQLRAHKEQWGSGFESKEQERLTSIIQDPSSSTGFSKVDNLGNKIMNVPAPSSSLDKNRGITDTTFSTKRAQLKKELRELTAVYKIIHENRPKNGNEFTEQADPHNKNKTVTLSAVENRIREIDNELSGLDDLINRGGGVQSEFTEITGSGTYPPLRMRDGSIIYFDEQGNQTLE